MVLSISIHLAKVPDRCLFCWKEQKRSRLWFFWQLLGMNVLHLSTLKQGNREGLLSKHFLDSKTRNKNVLLSLWSYMSTSHPGSSTMGSTNWLKQRIHSSSVDSIKEIKEMLTVILNLCFPFFTRLRLSHTLLYRNVWWKYFLVSVMWFLWVHTVDLSFFLPSFVVIKVFLKAAGSIRLQNSTFSACKLTFW